MDLPSVDSEFNCELVVLQIGGTIFPVIRSIFNESPVFKDMFSVPQPADAPEEGSSKAHPLKIDGVRKEDFRNFLRLFLPTRSLYSHAGPPSLGKDVWISVLHLAQMWQMTSLREDAIIQLTTLLKDPTEKLVLSDKYDVPAWSIPALLEFVNREAPLSEDDVRDIGLQRALKVVILRERRMRASARLEPAKCGDCGAAGYIATARKCDCDETCFSCSGVSLLGEVVPSTSPTSLVEQDIKDAFGLE